MKGSPTATASRIGWGGRIRTFEYGIQSPAPYRLATPHHAPDASVLDRTATRIFEHRPGNFMKKLTSGVAPNFAAQTVSLYDGPGSRQVVDGDGYRKGAH